MSSSPAPEATPVTPIDTVDKSKWAWYQQPPIEPQPNESRNDKAGRCVQLCYYTAVRSTLSAAAFFGVAEAVLRNLPVVKGPYLKVSWRARLIVGAGLSVGYGHFLSETTLIRCNHFHMQQEREKWKHY
jgi:hypothetical protein